MRLLDALLGRPAPRDSSVAEAILDRGRLVRRGALTASAAIVTPEEGKRRAKVRRAWQDGAFTYRRTLPEVGYVTRWLGNNAAHIRLTVGDRPQGVDEVAELDDDYDSAEGGALPADLVDASIEALLRLTGGAPSGGGAAILSPITSNYETVGECYLVGVYDPAANRGQGRETWAVHSIREVTFADGKLPGAPDTLDDGSPFPKGYYRLVTGEGRQADAVDLDPRYTTVVRLWTADTEWSSEPDAPLRALVGVCEQLLMIEKGRMAAFRSRAAGNGVLLMPEELSAPPDRDPATGELLDGDDLDPFDRDLVTQLTTPLTVDGSAAQVTPQVYWGAYQYLDRVRLLTFERPLDPLVAEAEQRLLARLGIGLDVPPEVITGLADTNHWNAWQISSDTFKHHQEPITIAACEALTLGYLRPRLRAMQRWDDALIDRVVLWYDPSNLVQQADMSAAANDAHDRKLITDKAYRTLRGIDESMAPDPADLDAGGGQTVGTTGMDADALGSVSRIAGELLRAGFDPAATATALGLGMIEHTGLVPVTVKPNEADEPPAALPAAPSSTPPAEGDDEPVDAEVVGDEVTPPASGARALTAAAPAPSDEQRRLSRRLGQIEQQLRDRIAVAAAAAITRALERAGNRVRARGQRDDTVREAAADLPGDRVVAAVGRTLVASLGFDEQQLLAEAFTALRGQYVEWTEAAAEEAIDTAARIAGLDRQAPDVQRMVAELRDRFHAGIDESWPELEARLDALATERMYEPDPAAPQVGEVPSVLVPPGLVREVLAVAGGLAADATGTGALSGLTSGALLNGFLRDAGVDVHEYEWSYGISARPFTPHARLDGQVITGFDDPELTTAGTGHEWVGGSFAPGDHRGCHCDLMPIYADGERTRSQLARIAEQSHREQYPDRPLPTRRATVDPDVYLPDTGLPEQRRSEAAQAAQVARDAGTPAALPVPPVEPVQAARSERRGRRRQAANDEAGIPFRLTFDYLDALDEAQLDDLAAHVLGRMDDASPVEGQRWDDLSAYLDARQDWEGIEPGLSTDEDYAEAWAAWTARHDRPGVATPRTATRTEADQQAGRPSRAEVQEEYALYIEQAYVDASAATRGYMLTPAAERAGINVRQLLAGPARRINRHASEELLAHLEQHPPLTFSQMYHARTGSGAWAQRAARDAAERHNISRDRGK